MQCKILNENDHGLNPQKEKKKDNNEGKKINIWCIDSQILE